MRLDFDLDPGSGEMPSDFASRLATRACRDSLRDFCADFGLEMQGIVGGKLDAVLALATLSRVDLTTLMEEAFIDQGGRRFRYKGQTFTRSTLSRDQVRVCTACLTEDVERLSFRVSARPHRRSEWVISAVRTCPKHGTALVDLGSHSELGRSHDTSRAIAVALPRLTQMTRHAVRRTPSAFETYVRSRLAGGHASPFLDELPLHVVLRLTLVVGAVARHGPRVTLETLGDGEIWTCEALGFGILEEGESGMRAFLDRLQAPFLDRRAAWGPKSMFGRLYEWLAHENSDPDYEPVRVLMMRHVAETLPVGTRDRMFGRRFPVRLLHSVHSAALQSGFHPKRLRKLLREEGMIDAASEKLSDDRVIIDAEIADAFLSKLGEAMTLKAAAAYLGVPRPLEVDLVRSGFIRPFVQGGSETLKNHAFLRTDLDRFMVKLRAKVDHRHPVDGRFTDIPTAARRSCCPSTKIVQLLMDGTLDRVALDPDVSGFLSILVDVEEVRRHVAGPDHGGVTLREVERVLGTSTPVVTKLLEKGILQSVSVVNPVMKRTQTVVRPEELDRFRKEYVLLNALAKERSRHFKRVKNELAAAGVKPVTDPAELRATLYRRSDIG